MIYYFKAIEAVPQAVPQSMCHRISCVMSFGTLNLGHPEVVVL